MPSFASLSFGGNKKIYAAIIASLLILAMLVPSLREKYSEPVKAERESYKLGTVVRLTVYGSDEKKLDSALTDAMNEIDRLEGLFSVNIPSSEISKVNSSKSGRVKVGRECADITSFSLRQAKMTNGAFDPTIEPIVKLWGIGTDSPRVPSSDEIKNALKYVDYKKISVKDGFIIKGEGQKLDMGAAAKGWIADRLAEMLKKRGIKSAIIDLGGNLSVIGESPKKRPWKLGLQHPAKPRGEYFAIVEASDTSVVTSGPYERNFTKDGHLYHHIFDTKTGYPAESDLASVTVISQNSALADTLCTGLFAMGLEKASELVLSEGVSAVFVSKDYKNIYVTKDISSALSLKDDTMKLHIIGESKN